VKILTAKHLNEWVTLANDWLSEKVRTTGARRLYLPAGETPIPIYQNWTKAEPAFLKSLGLYQIDEVLTGPRRGMFKSFFEEQLPNLQNQFTWIEGGGYEPADLAILGLGLNGHVAFHEPHLPLEFKYGEVELSPETCSRLDISPGTKGLTYGLGSFMNCKAVLMIVRGESKQTIVNRLANENESLPAHALKQHADFSLLQM
jgi:6-phosphogluconolactonase/glucosamine-6-phosphate isomerase/deaminase